MPHHPWPPRAPDMTQTEWPWFVGGDLNEETVDWARVHGRTYEHVVIVDPIPECTCVANETSMFACAVHGEGASVETLERWEALNIRPGDPIPPTSEITFREECYYDRKVAYQTAALPGGNRRVVEVRVLAHSSISPDDLAHLMLLRAFGIADASDSQDCPF